MKIEFEIQITFFSKDQMIVLTHTFAIPRKKLMGKVDKNKLQKLEDALFEQMLATADWAD